MNNVKCSFLFIDSFVDKLSNEKAFLAIFHFVYFQSELNQLLNTYYLIRNIKMFAIIALAISHIPIQITELFGHCFTINIVIVILVSVSNKNRHIFCSFIFV